jgi:hypothetical protein
MLTVSSDAMIPVMGGVAVGSGVSVGGAGVGVMVGVSVAVGSGVNVANGVAVNLGVRLKMGASVAVAGTSSTLSLPRAPHALSMTAIMIKAKILLVIELRFDTP